MNTNHPLVGRRVLNRHRQYLELSAEDRAEHSGTVMGVLQGCNPLVSVRFDGRDYDVAMCLSDMAFCDIWPAPESRLTSAHAD